MLDEEDRVKVTCGHQNPTSTQTMLMSVLGLPAHKVEVACRRVGGGYGGKLEYHKQTAAAAAIAATKLRLPVQLHNERVDDMAMMGGREAMDVDYTVTCDSTGLISDVSMLYEADGGNDKTMSVGSLFMATAWSDGCYYTGGEFESKGNLIKTSKPGNSSCRAPGNLQSISVREIINEHVAMHLAMDINAVRELNFYQEGQMTPFGDLIGSSVFNWTVPELWSNLKQKANYEARREAVTKFNAENRYRKRGLSMSPTKYGMGGDGYQIGTLLNVYASDGTVEVHHGGCEIGQGINTKVAQAVAYALGIPLESILVGENNTRINPNNGGTGGSGTSETAVQSALNACATLNATLEPYLAAHGGDWAKACAAAGSAGENLSITSFYMPSSLNPNPDSTTGFDYATQGAACSEVEIDCLTGEVQILQVDLDMDLGNSLNPAVDIGQVEGGFIMAVGYFLTEEVIQNSGEAQLNLGTWNYK